MLIMLTLISGPKTVTNCSLKLPLDIVAVEHSGFYLYLYNLATDSFGILLMLV